MYKIYFLLSALVISSVAHSGEVAKYYGSEPYKCGMNLESFQLALIPETDDSIAIHLFTSTTNSSTFNGVLERHHAIQQTFTPAELSSTVRLADGFFKVDISNALSEQPLAERLDFAGNVARDCQPVLHKVDSPQERLNQLKQLLSKQLPSPSDVVAVTSSYTELAPLQLYPALEQGEMQSQLKELIPAFWERYKQAALAAAAELGDAEILPDLESSWLSQSINDRKLHADLLLEAQTRRGMSLMSSMETLGSSSLGSEDLCKRVDNISLRWSNLQFYVELATSVPIAFWTQEFADEQIVASSACENEQFFTQNVTRFWQAYEKNLNGYARLREENQSITESKVTIEALAQKDWFSVDAQFTQKLIQARVSEEAIEALYIKPLESKRQQALETLPEEAAGRLVTDGMSSVDYSDFCLREFASGGDGSDLKASMVDQCNAYLANDFLAVSLDELQTKKEEWLAMPATKATLFAYRKGSLSNNRSHPFNAVAGKLSVAEAVANKDIMQGLSSVRDDLQLELEESYRKVDFKNNKKDELDALCAQISSAKKNVTVLSLNRECAKYAKQYEQELELFGIEQQKKQCLGLWSQLNLPNKLDDVQIPLPDGGMLALQKMYCDAKKEDIDFNISSQEVEGSIEFRLSRTEVIENSPAVFHVRLNAPKTEGQNWYFDAGEMEPDMFDSERFVSHNALLDCLMTPERCIRR